MGRTGRTNPLPYHLGGSASPTQQVWSALRRAVGRTGSGEDVAGPVGGIEDGWRLAKARAVARCMQLESLAVLQALPHLATVSLGAYERQLGVPAAANQTLRAATVAHAFATQLSAIVRELEPALAAIDSGISLHVTPRDAARTTYFGRMLGSRVDFTYGAHPAASHPNISSHFVLVVDWSGAPDGLIPAGARRRVERHLNAMLPSWCDYRIRNGSGFYLDGFNGSRLDLTAFDD